MSSLRIGGVGKSLYGVLGGSVLVLASAFAPQGAFAIEDFTDNFNATGDPGPGNDYLLNEQLDVRQGGSLAPSLYTRIAGGANLVQVNNPTPDADCTGPDPCESGLGKMDFFNLDFSAVELNLLGSYQSVTLEVEATPVANFAARTSDDWACINVGATGGNGFVNNAQAGVGMLIRDNGGYQVFNNGPLIAQGNVPAAGTYLLRIDLDVVSQLYSLEIDGNAVIVNQPVSTSGFRIQFGGIGGAPPGQGFNKHTLDNLNITVEPSTISACCTASQTSGAAPLDVDFDASCSLAQGMIQSYAWDFGDGTNDTGQMVSHTYNVPDTYVVTLTVTDTDGNSASVEKVISVCLDAYEDDFERPDGPVDGWTTTFGTWDLLDGRLHTGPSVGEHWIWAGSPPVCLGDNFTISYTYEYLSPGTVPVVGRHGGVMFCTNRATQRTDGAITGYTLDWIDRVDDHGMRLIRWGGGAATGLHIGTPQLAEPPLDWEVEVDGQHIRCFGDGVLYIDVVDGTYRGGFFGFWTWDGGQEVAIDDVLVTSPPLAACFTASPPSFAVLPAATFLFDASCSQVSSGGVITEYSWDFGDGNSDTGASVMHTYSFEDSYTVTLTIRDNRGNSASTTLTVRVVAPLVPFADCFERAPGPVDGWTAAVGEWNITADGKLNSVTAGVEPWVWAGDPTRPLVGEFVAEADFEFLAQPADGVGRHGGFAFFASVPTHRYDGVFQGYTIDWIDRIDDHGYRLLRVDNAAQIPLAVGTPGIAEPALRWRIEVDGDTIRFLADGVLIFEVVDSTYRSGFFGAWAWVNGQNVTVDNVAIPPSAQTTCRVELTCTVTATDPPMVHVEGGVVAGDCGCVCTAIELTANGSPVPIDDLGGNFNADIPFPAGCTTLEIAARCTGGEAATCSVPCPPSGGGQIPGDSTQDGRLDISDGIRLLGFLFLGSPTRLPCGNGGVTDPANVTLEDAGGNGAIELSDAVRIFVYLFLGGPPHVLGTGCVAIAGCESVCTP
jgi:PKD repeat protein